MLRISIERTAREPLKVANEPADRILDRVDETNIGKSRGYLALRRWFSSLSKGGKQRARTWMSTQLDGVLKMKAAIEAQGDTFSYADLNFDIRAAKTGELISGPSFGPDDSTAPTTGDGEETPTEEQPT